MGMFQGMSITASALSAQRLRMDTISSNMANAETTRGSYVNGEWEPYRRKSVVLQEKDNQFSSFLNQAMNKNTDIGSGVKVSQIVEDQTPNELIYNPDHPDANEDGYVEMPNVDPLRETIDLMSATRSYEANVTALNASKGMLMKALEIGK
ncbi:flagellar basal body rod protein FlgC [Peribacillus psychrosaccharolyticus]|uniref:Flagellar basal-body rod protein FlgC n=1 Tax=Peribacillus psychrosaccharolyticus TaxID=1407 RepID=A0A974NPA6_PERPY|nr:flagellar basal body rod protein FlgC [Peribacillus psychrosaccharolyticus]MEC2053799.1 flagellar basal body rod protein FlgC [Peribacillus psychrosaccharolyticus]MED3742587.1 flagellar basal body rod protein FlgC [Peribacillus psychrosaccharolyticus]QQT01534.1 flagellar basal body rod protein FlgC [Peribacillus psychrosaccharolyticus]